MDCPVPSSSRNLVPVGLSSAPWKISEATNHCVNTFEILRLQREQMRYCDLVLSIQGRHFHAHRCVLASVSSWFDSRLKMHKTVKEEIEVDCKNLEVFHAVLTYFYTGQITIDRNNVAELVYLADYFTINKLRTHCCEYLVRHLHTKNVFHVLDLAVKYNLPDVMKQSFGVIQRDFNLLYDTQHIKALSLTTVQNFLSEQYWPISQELLLTFIARWVEYHPHDREESFIHLLQFINWQTINLDFVFDHLDREQLYQINPESLLGILHVLKGNQINIGQRFQEMYQSLQEKLLPDQDLDELNDSNSFLSIAINSAVKDLDSEVDPDWFLQNEPPPQPDGQSGAGNIPPQSLPPPPPPPPPPPSLIPRSETLVPLPVSSASSSTSNFIRGEKGDKYKDLDIPLEIVEQVINEQRMVDDERSKYRGDTSNSIKRYDPKFRALTEVFRQETDETMMSYSKYGQHHHSHSMSQGVHEQRHHGEAIASGQEMHKIYKYPDLVQDKHKHSHSDSYEKSYYSQQSSEMVSDFLEDDPPAPPSSEEETVSEVDLPIPPPPPTPHPPPSSMLKMQPSILAKNEEEIQRKLLEIHEDQRRTEIANIVSSYREEMGSETKLKSQKQHVKKAKLLAQHRSQSDETNNKDLQIEISRVENVPTTVEEPKVIESQANEPKPIGISENQRVKKGYIYTCDICQLPCKGVKEKRLHIRQVHFPKSPPYVCEHANCSFKVDKLHRFLLHLQTHSTNANWKCSQCDFATRTKSRLHEHEKTHNRRFECEQCSKRYPSQRALDIHLLSHTEDKPFKCSKCSFQTKYMSHLQVHLKGHEGKTFRCEFEGCSYETPRQSLMSSHRRIHLKEKKFVCPECSRGFVEKSQMKRHVRTMHSDEKPFDCHVCQFKTKRKDKLKLHLLRVHKTTEMAKSD